MLAQLIARAVIFLLFLLAIFVVVPALRFLFILFIIANIVLGFINGKKSIPENIIFIILTPSLFIPVLEYLTTVILVVLTGVHLLRFYLWFRKGGVDVKKKEEEKKKKFHILGLQIAVPIIILIFLILFILFILLMALLFFSTTSVGIG